MHSIGESPSDGSSSMRIAGADIIARPMATVCCSLPLMVRATCRLRSAPREEREDAFEMLALGLSRAPRAGFDDGTVERQRRHRCHGADHRHCSRRNSSSHSTSSMHGRRSGHTSIELMNVDPASIHLRVDSS